jgi:hypothetical protein
MESMIAIPIREAIEKVPSRITMQEGKLDWLTIPRFLRKTGYFYYMKEGVRNE